MKTSRSPLLVFILLAGLLAPLCLSAQDSAKEAKIALTIYNQNFAVVRDTLPLNLKAGENKVSYNDATFFIEPESIILRDPAGENEITILEQNYRNDPVSEQLLLSLFEGETIDFQINVTSHGEPEVVQGKIIRGGYGPNTTQYYAYRNSTGQEPPAPIIEVDGKLRFSLPGEPLFPSLQDDNILKPSLNWRLFSESDTRFEAELAYISGRMSWKADYNVIGKGDTDLVDIIGWITIDNHSGKVFQDAAVKLMAGDFEKLNLEDNNLRAPVSSGFRASSANESLPEVKQKSFDEYHLYELPLTVTVRNQETKQVEFLNASKVPAKKLFVYHGAFIEENRYRGYSWSQRRTEQGYGTESNPKVWIMREFINSEENDLGMPLPKGILRFYQRDEDDNRLEFLGENEIDHTPQDEKVRVYTGNAFDLVGERKPTDFKLDNSRRELFESIEVNVRNRKEKDTVEIIVVEELYRWLQWEITESSMDYEKTDSKTIEFRVSLEPGEEKTVTYTVHYTW